MSLPEVTWFLERIVKTPSCLMYHTSRVIYTVLAFEISDGPACYRFDNSICSTSHNLKLSQALHREQHNKIVGALYNIESNPWFTPPNYNVAPNIIFLFQVITYCILIKMIKQRRRNKIKNKSRHALPIQYK